MEKKRKTFVSPNFLIYRCGERTLRVGSKSIKGFRTLLNLAMCFPEVRALLGLPELEKEKPSKKK